MKKKFVIAAALLGLTSGVLAADDTSAPPTRKEVHDQTRGEIKSGRITPGGDAGDAGIKPSTGSMSSENRAAAKKRTRAANKKGEIAAGGEAGVAAEPSPSTKSREAVRARTKAENRAGDIHPGGETGVPAGK